MKSITYLYKYYWNLNATGSTKLYLAVLHPRKLAVYSVEAVQAAVDYGSHASVTLQYEHNLQVGALYVCVRERERDRQTDTETVTERETETQRDLERQR